MNTRIVCLAVIIIVLTSFPGLVEAVPPSDDFNDNSKGSMWGWFWIGQGPSTTWLDETNQRLELRATSAAVDNTAIYGSVGWGIVTAEDFQMKIDFYHSSTQNQSVVFIAIVNNFDLIRFPETGDYIQIGAGYSSDFQIFAYERGANLVPIEQDAKFRPLNSGKLYISYDANLDEVYLSETGYGSVNAWKTVTGVIQGVWGRSVVGVAVGGNSDGVALSSGQAYLDNFVIDTGTWCDGLPVTDLNEDCKTDFYDFAILAAGWLDCNMDPPEDCW